MTQKHENETGATLSPIDAALIVAVANSGILPPTEPGGDYKAALRVLADSQKTGRPTAGYLLGILAAEVRRLREEHAHAGTEFVIDAKGLAPEWDEDGMTLKAAREYFAREGKGAKVEAKWDADWFKTGLKYTLAEAMTDAEGWISGATFHAESRGWRPAVALMREEILRLREELDRAAEWHRHHGREIETLRETHGALIDAICHARQCADGKPEGWRESVIAILNKAVAAIEARRKNTPAKEVARHV